jgi:hypothetical protein
MDKRNGIIDPSRNAYTTPSMPLKPNNHRKVTQKKNLEMPKEPCIRAEYPILKFPIKKPLFIIEIANDKILIANIKINGMVM